MNSLLKVGLWAGAIGLVAWGIRAGKKAFDDFQVDVVGYGRPTLAGTLITVPLQLRFKNPTPLPITLERLYADIYLNKAGEFVPAAKINQPITIAPGVTNQWLMPQLNLSKIFGGNLLNTTLAIQQIIATKKILLRSDVEVTYKGVTLPVQSFTNTVEL